MKENPSNYDAWFDYLRLVESEGNVDEIRETYERAIANVPPTKVYFYPCFYKRNFNAINSQYNYLLCFRIKSFGEDIFTFG